MVDGELFDKLARLGSMLRKDPKPFGGIQVIISLLLGRGLADKYVRTLR